MSRNVVQSRACKIGITILSIWFLFNILPGVGSLIYIAMGNHAPALQYHFASGGLSALDPHAVETIDALAIMVNALITVYCFLAFFVVRTALVAGNRHALFVLFTGTCFLQLASYWSDMNLAGQNIWVIHFSSAIFLTGFGACAYGLFCNTVEEQ